MLYVKFAAGRAVEVTTEYPRVGDHFDTRYQNRNDWRSFEQVERIAAELTQQTGTAFIATDAGEYVSPRYDVIHAPVVGAQVSGYFNGDSYPEGEIVKVSASLKRVETSTGAVFTRRGKTGQWLKNKTWTLIQGHHSERNPSF